MYLSIRPYGAQLSFFKCAMYLALGGIYTVYERYKRHIRDGSTVGTV